MIVKIIFWLLLVDSLIVNYIAWSKCEAYFSTFALFRRYFPITKGWTIWYLVLSLFIGYLIYFYKI